MTYRHFFVIVALLLSITASSQVVSSITVDKDSTGIGEEIMIFYKLTFPFEGNLLSLDMSEVDSMYSLVSTNPQSDTINTGYFAEIELTDIDDHSAIPVNPSLIVSTGGAKKVYTDTLSAVIWDFGVFSLPHPRPIFSDPVSFAPDIVRLESPRIRVYPPALTSPIDTNQVILPIVPIIKEGRSIEDYLWLFLVIGGFVLASLVAWIVSKKKRSTREKVVIKVKRPGHVIALEKLNELEKEKLWQAGRIKEYQSRLTHIIREYLENRFNIQALESTTDEIIMALRQNALDKDNEQTLVQILQIADLVKFAKAKPPVDIHAAFLKKAEAFVDCTKETAQEFHNETSENG